MCCTVLEDVNFFHRSLNDKTETDYLTHLLESTHGGYV